jgi:adenylate cyclase class IV
MYEVEYKVEITRDERAKLDALFRKDGFQVKEVVTQNDYYTEVTDSPLGGYNFKRYRDEGKKLFYTEKIKEEVKGESVRREIENEISRGEFIEAIVKYPKALKITKDRQSYLGKYQDKKLHIDMDSVKFDHSPSMRYFIEAEIMTQDQSEVKILKELVKEFLKTLLGKEEVENAPGMFYMAFHKK